jgi:hypothetical protein
MIVILSDSSNDIGNGINGDNGSSIDSDVGIDSDGSSSDINK